MATDLSKPDLDQAILAFWKEKSSLNPLSKLGFFSAPVLVKEGPLAGLVLKKYPGRRKRSDVDTLIKHHDRYVNALRCLGVVVPATTMRVVPQGRWVYPVVLQEAFLPDELARYQLENASGLDDYLQSVKSLLLLTLDFIAKRTEADLHIGFHPTTRNYSVRDGQWYYFDTFPPMPMDQKALNRLMCSYLPIPHALRLLIAPSWLDRVTSEYYDSSKMLTGIVGSACRLRPGDATDILAFCRNILSERIPDPSLRTQVLQSLDQPPRLSSLWVLLRRVLGKSGAPNIHM